MEPGIAVNLEMVRAAISQAEQISGRAPGSVELIAVTKTHPPEVIQNAIDAGQLLFGENRVQEARAKISGLPSKLRWHLIGHLQSNKVRIALSLFEIIHGVIPFSCLARINRVQNNSGCFPKSCSR